MTGGELREALDAIGLTETEAARLLYITPNALLQYVNGQRKIPGPMVAAVEAWQRHGAPPGATLATEHIKPAQLKLMRELRDSLSEEPGDKKPHGKRKAKPGSS